jgi:hypothetical protein
MLVAVPAIGATQTPAQSPAPKPAATAKAAASKPAKAGKTASPAAKAEAVHATKGVVKSVDAGSLVITRAAKAKDMTFVLNSSTQTTGTPVVGASVQVRYKSDAKQNIATAVSVQSKK